MVKDVDVVDITMDTAMNKNMKNQVERAVDVVEILMVV